jgi:hypothetical protein
LVGQFNGAIQRGTVDDVGSVQNQLDSYRIG